jgi:hypothetical protein
MIVGVSVSGWGTACRAPTDDRDRTAQRRRRRSLSSAPPHRRSDGRTHATAQRARRSVVRDRCFQQSVRRPVSAALRRTSAVFIAIEPLRTNAVPCAPRVATTLRGGRRAAIRHRPSSSARLRSCGLKPSLSVWKPLRGWRVCHPSLCREGRRVDPARRACPTSDRAYGL